MKSTQFMVQKLDALIINVESEDLVSREMYQLNNIKGKGRADNNSQ